MINKRAFTVIEIMIAIAIIGFGLSLLLPSFKDSTIWTKDNQNKIDIEKINQAVDYYKVEFGPENLSDGNNDYEHHSKVLKQLEKFLITKNINITELKSTGHGKTFHFTEYSSMKPNIAAQNVANHPSSFKWHFNINAIKPELSDFKSQNINNTNKSNSLVSEKTLIENLEKFINNRQRKQSKIEKVVYFENPGSCQWIVPDGVESITVEAIGAGGSGEKAWIESQWTAPIPLNTIHNDRGCNPCGIVKYVQGNIGQHNLECPGRLKLENITIPENHTLTIKFFKDNILLKSRMIQTSEFKLFSHDILEKGTIRFELHYDPAPGQYQGRCQVSPITFSKYIQKIDPNGGGGAGAYIKKTFLNLSGGETFFMNIGQGFLNENGGATSLRFNQNNILCEGGKKANGRESGIGGIASGGDINSSGDSGMHSQVGGSGGQGKLKASSGLEYRGSGGNGNNSSGDPGRHGMVKITYKG